MEQFRDDKKRNENFRKAWAKVIAMAWSDEVFKKRLLKHPEEVLKEYGIPLMRGITYQVHENTEKVCHLVIPQKRAGLDEEQIKQIAAAGMTYHRDGCDNH